MFYNPKRKHTNNDILSPVDFETRQHELNMAGVQETRGTSDCARSPPSLPGPWLELSLQKIVGPKSSISAYRSRTVTQAISAVAASLPRRSKMPGAFKECLLPLMDHRRLDPISDRLFRHVALALQRHRRLERRVVVLASRHLLCPFSLETSRLQIAASVTVRFSRG